MKSTLLSIERAVDRIMKFTSIVLKLSIALGGACVILYSVRIGHFPQGLALGDGLLFILAAGCFGLLYAIFVVGLIGLGSCLSPVTKRVLKISSRIMTKLCVRRKELYCRLEPFQLAAAPFAFIALLMIGELGRQDYMVYLTLIAVAIMLHIVYSTVVDAGRKLRTAEKLQGTIIDTPEKANAFKEEQRHKSICLIGCCLMLMLPLTIGGVSGQLVDGAMRLAHVRVDDAVIYTKAPYNTLLPDTLIAKDLEAPTGYKAYKEISVRFKGFGITTVIAFKDGTTARQLEIPNDQIIVETQTAKH